MLKGKQREIQIIALLIILLLQSVISVAQTGYGSEKELKKKADGFFDKDDFVTCLPMYSQLLSIYPKDPEYNYRYGVCNLIAGNEKDKSIAYLTLASKSEEVDKEVFYYLGRALHLNYRFDEAIANYGIFKTKASAKSLTKLDVNRQIEMCNNGKDLLRSVTDLRVVEKNEFPITDYFRAYDLTAIDTRILVKPEDMQTVVDKKKNDQSVIVQKNNAQEIYYSSYGEDPKGSRDIYKIVKLPNYTFSKPIKLSDDINTKYDEEFPYITPDGKTLFFCSKGHNSMGGYDIFKSDYNIETGKYSKPVNLDFAINTPDDDILYIYDGKGEFAYFSSKRSSGAGKVSVYKIINQRVPGTVAMVKGNFFTTDEKTHQAAKIILKNQSGTKIIGAYNVNPKTGDYQFMIRQGETYSLTVESKDYETMSREVQIPVLTELTPIKQKINLKHEGNSDLLTISTEVETNTSPELLQAAMALLRERANLDVESGPSLENSQNTNKPSTKPDEVKPKTSNENITSNPSNGAIETNNLADKTNSAENKIPDNALQQKPEITNSSEANKTKTNDGSLVDSRPVLNTTNNSKPNIKEGNKNQTTEKEAITSANGASISTNDENNIATKNQNSSKTNENQVEQNKTLTVKNKAEESPFAKKASLVSEAFNLIKKQEQDAIDLDLKSVEEKKKIPEKNDSAKLVDFRIDELNTMTAKLKNPQQLEIAKERIVEFKDEADGLRKGALEAATKSEQFKSDAIKKRADAIEQKAFATKLEAAAKSNNQKAFDDLYYSKYPKTQSNDNATAAQLNINGDNLKSVDQLKSEIAALQEKSKTLKADATKTNNAQVKSALAKQINTTNLQIKDKQAIVATKENNTIITNNTNVNSNAIDVKNSPDTKVLIARGNMLLNESAQLKNEATESRKNAATIGDANTKNTELIRASNIDKEARGKEIEAYTALMQANALMRKQMDAQINQNATNTNINKTNPLYATANNLNIQAKDGFVSAQQARISAANEPNQKVKVERFKDAYESEKLALQQQKRSLETFQQLTGSTASNSNTKASNNNANATKEEVNTAFEKSEKYPEYTTLNNEHKALEEKIIPKKAEIDTLKKTSQKEQATASDLRSYAETLKNKTKKESAVSAANIYENNASKINTQVSVKQKEVDSLTMVSNEKKTQANGIYNKFETDYKGNSTTENSSLPVTTNAKSENKSAVKPIKDLDITQEELDIILSKPEYLKYYQTRYLGDSIEYEYKKAFSEVEIIKVEADKLIAEKEKVDKEYSKEKVLTQKQELRAQAKKLDVEITKKIAYADSLYENAQAYAKKIELADNKLQVVVNKLDDKSAMDYPIIYDAVKRKPFNLTKAQYQEKLASANAPAKKQEINTDVPNNVSNVTEANTNEKTVQNSATSNSSNSEPKPELNLIGKQPNLDTQNNKLDIAPNNNTAASIETNKNSEQNKLDATNTTKSNTETAQTTAKNVGTQPTETSNKNNDVLPTKNNELAANTSTSNNETNSKLNADGITPTNGAQQTKQTTAPIINNNKSETKTEIKTNANTTAKSNVKPVEGLDYTQDEIDRILKTPEYLRYYRDKYNGDSLEYVYQKVYKQVESLKVSADKLYEEREALLEDSKLEKDPKKKQEMKKLAKEKEAEASSKIDDADMLYITAQELAKKIEESDKKLQAVVNKLTDKNADEFPLIYNTLAQKPFDKTVEEYNQMLAAKNTNSATSEPINTANDSKPQLNTKNKSNDGEKSNNEILTQNTNDGEVNITIKGKNGNATNGNATNGNIADGNIADGNVTNGNVTNGNVTEKNKLAAFNTKKNNRKNRKNKTEKQTTIAETKTTIAAETVTAQAGYDLTTEEFEIKQQNAYTDEIPLDIAMPKGIIFRVQLGAYKRKVAANVFGGISPVSGETSKTGMIRYSAGLFKVFANCNAARKRVGAIGFNDAFVIAFCNGKRIDVNLARKMIADGIDCEGANSNNTESIAQNNLTSETEPITDEVKQILATQKNLKQTEGLLYTVQVGVYKKLISTTRLYNLNELYYDTLRKGLIRYSHGVFNDRAAANAAKAKIVEIGIKDAFVIPYFNKRYLPTAEAERLIANDRTILIKDNLVTKSTNTNAVAINSSNVPNLASIANLKFKVQLGVFRKTVPVEIMSKYLKLANKGINETVTTDGMTIYTIGEYSTIEDADKTKAEAIEVGVTDAFVTPYNNGVKISLDAALKLLGK